MVIQWSFKGPDREFDAFDLYVHLILASYLG